MKKFKPALAVAFGVLLLASGVAHFLKPEVFYPFFPDFVPKDITNYFAGAVEITLALGLFIPRFRSRAALGTLLLMVAFLPLHTIDVFKENPAIGSHQLALIRLPLQFVLILWAWLIYRK